MIRFFAKHPTAANLLMLTLLILGISSLSTTKRETFPEFDPPYILAGEIGRASCRERVLLIV